MYSHITEPGEDGKLLIKLSCKECKNHRVLEVSREGYQNWRRGQYIQRALREISAGDREMLISGTCPTCFDLMFGEEEDGLDI